MQCLRGQRGQQPDLASQQQEDIAAVAPLIFKIVGGSSGVPHLAALASHLSPHMLHVLTSLQSAHVRDCHTVRFYSLCAFNLVNLAGMARHCPITLCSARSQPSLLKSQNELPFGDLRCPNVEGTAGTAVRCNTKQCSHTPYPAHAA